MELGECAVETVGDRLLLTFIYICGETDAEDGDYGRCGSHLDVEVDGVILSVGCDEATKAAAESCKAGDGGVDTHTHCDDAQHDERYGHRERCLMRSVMSMQFLVLSAPEDAVVETEHIECRHGSHTGHNPTYERTIGEAGGDNLVLGAEAREERNTGDGKA